MSGKRFSWFLAWALVFSACQLAPVPDVQPGTSSTAPVFTASAAVTTSPADQSSAAGQPTETSPAADSDAPSRPTLRSDLAGAISFGAAIPPGFAIHIFKLNQPVLAEEVGYEQVWMALKDQSRWVQSGEQTLPASQDLISNGDQLETSHLLLGADDLYAAMQTNAGSLDVTIRVYRDQKSIYEMPAENIYVRPPLYGLWAYGDHWALEVLDSIVIDGAAVNTANHYEKSYEFALLGGKPVYLFEKSGQSGVNLDGQEVLLPGQTVTHYECCSGSLLNPRQGANMLVFFMSQGPQWFYVEIERLPE